MKRFSTSPALEQPWTRLTSSSQTIRTPVIEMENFSTPWDKPTKCQWRFKEKVKCFFMFLFILLLLHRYYPFVRLPLRTVFCLHKKCSIFFQPVAVSILLLCAIPTIGVRYSQVCLQLFDALPPHWGSHHTNVHSDIGSPINKCAGVSIIICFIYFIYHNRKRL